MIRPMFTETHAHLYVKTFDGDRDKMIRRALDRGVTRIFLPNIDTGTLDDMLLLADTYPGSCFPMVGLHPTSVRENFLADLKEMEQSLDRKDIVAIGETGIDLYWDKTFLRQQVESFRIQISWARERGLPVVIHARESFREIFEVLDQSAGQDLRGVFHSFTGSLEELEKALSYGFMIGINGIVTFKNSGLDRIVREIPPDRLLLETDAPFLAPVPYRGKRNESSYLPEVALKVAEIYQFTRDEVARITTRNAEELFRPERVPDS